MIRNKIIQGDCTMVMKTLADNSISCCITSPPYHGLRSYLKDTQPGKHLEIGSGENHAAFLEKLLEVTAEIKRVLKKDGSFWLNIGDVYAGGGREFIGKQAYLGKSAGRRVKEDYPAKCMIMSPERLAIKMIDEQGWILRDKIVWVKQVLFVNENITKGSAMPCSCKDRFNNTWEYLFHFTKSKRYYFNLDAVRIPVQTKENRPDGMTRCREFGYNSKFMDSYTPQNKQSGHREYQGKFTGSEDAESFNSPRARTQRKEYDGKFMGVDRTKNGSPYGREEYVKGQRKIDGRDLSGNRGADGKEMAMPEKWNNPEGKNIPNVWQLSPEIHNHKKELGVDVDHFAAFPCELIRTPIIASCPKDGIVLDPFCGSGTVPFVAKQEGRDYLGIELNPDYIHLAETRLEKYLGELPIEKILNPSHYD